MPFCFRCSWRALRLPMNHKIKSKPITELGSKQLLTYLKLKGLRLGFVLNFRGSLMKDGIERVVNGLSDVNLGRRSVQFRQNILCTCKGSCCFRLPFCLDQELENLRVLASWRDRFFVLVAALSPRVLASWREAEKVELTSLDTGCTQLPPGN